mmetsp:Transcript_29770/g.62394  ORF Transcript_29770/g.62394 Transcript_29770/m.62394 type:complete len:322 (-) Transcript_29770:609-1574(-)
MGSPIQRDAVRRVVRVERNVLQKRIHADRQHEIFILVQIKVRPRVRGFVRSNGVDQGVEVEARKVGILRLNIRTGWMMIHADVHLPWATVVKVRERNAILCPNLLPNDDLVDVVELVPVLLINVVIAIQGLELRPTRDCKIQRLGRVERLGIEEVEVVLVGQIAEQLRRQAIEGAHDGHVQPPAPVACAVHKLGVLERAMAVVEPVQDRGVLLLVELHLHSFEGLHVQKIVAVVERRLLIIERGEAHSPEVATVTLLTTHHDPHCSPLSNKDWLDDLGHVIHKSNRPSDVVQDVHVAHLLPRHRHVLKQFQNRVRHIFQSP